MGIFDFVRSFGKKTDAPAQESHADQMAERQKGIQLTGALRQLNLPVADLRVDYDDGTATLHGLVDSPEISHKLIVALGNMADVGRVDDRTAVRPPPAAPTATAAAAKPAAPPKPPPILYTVQKGDTLSLIAKAQYGCIHLYPAIFAANQPMIKDADEIEPGMVLTIPPSPTPLVHTVQKGETLSKIAKHHYGDPARYTTLFEANRSTLSDPDRIEVGQKLTVPLLRHPAPPANA